MLDTVARTRSIAPPLWLTGPVALLSAAVALALAGFQQVYFPLSTTVVVAALAVVVFCTVFVFGPSRIVLTLVFLLALLDHQFRSPIILPVGGVEWHPRELLLLVLFAHVMVKVAQQRFWITWTPMHVAMLLYTCVFAYAAWRGLWLGNDLRAIIAECRAPLFLGAFWAFSGTMGMSRDRFYYGYLALCFVTLMAVATVVAFVYFAVAGPIPNTQNFLGEFVPRIIAGSSLQSIRPSGHAWFEAALVVSVAMLLCPREPWYRKTIYVGLAVLMAGAIGAGMMRTAFVSVAMSMVALLWLNLPRPGKGLLLALVLLVLTGWGFAALLRGEGNGTPTFRDHALNARVIETEGAMEAIRQHPLLGSGFGSSFEALGLAQRDSSTSAVPVAYRSLHNVWIYIAWKAGLVGLALAVLALVGMLISSQCLVARLPSMSQRCLGRALQAVLIGQIVASAAMPRLTYANGALFLGIWLMAMVLLGREAEGDRERVTQLAIQ